MEWDTSLDFEARLEGNCGSIGLDDEMWGEYNKKRLGLIQMGR